MKSLSRYQDSKPTTEYETSKKLSIAKFDPTGYYNENTDNKAEDNEDNIDN
jgi:hypothetical protein